MLGLTYPRLKKRNYLLATSSSSTRRPHCITLPETDFHPILKGE